MNLRVRRSPRPAEVAALEVTRSISGEPVVWPLGMGSVLVAGVTGSGKSVALRWFLAQAALRPDVAMVGIDLKGGVELAPWVPRLHALAADRSEARRLLLSVAALLGDRLRVLRAHEATAWDPSWGPWLLVVVDELAELVSGTTKAEREQAADTLAILVSIGRIGRALGIHLVAATQRPDAETLSGALRGQLDWRLGLRVRAPEESRMVCAHEVADLTTLGGTGESYWLPPLPHRVRLARAPFLSVAQAAEVARSTADRRPAGVDMITAWLLVAIVVALVAVLIFVGSDELPVTGLVASGLGSFTLGLGLFLTPVFIAPGAVVMGVGLARIARRNHGPIDPVGSLLASAGCPASADPGPGRGALVQPFELVGPVQPVQPVQPVELVQPFELVGPVQPVQPVQPVEPFEPVELGESEAYEPPEILEPVLEPEPNPVDVLARDLVALGSTVEEVATLTAR